MSKSNRTDVAKAILNTPLPPCGSASAETGATRLRDAAARYARRGYAVVPVRPHAKNPYIKDWEQHPLRTAEEVKAHWEAHPLDNVGWMMGDEFVVLDFDSKDGKQGTGTLAWLAAAYPPIRSTLTQRSQSGSWHKVLKLTPAQRCKLGKHTNVKLGPHADNSGLDIITRNAIIVVEPSTTPNGAYRWEDVDAEIKEMPDDLFDLLLTVETARAEPANDTAGATPSEMPSKVILDDDVIIALLRDGWTSGCGYPSPSEARAAAYRALHTAGYNLANIVWVFERSPLRKHGDPARQPLSGQALIEDIERVLALPYNESTMARAGGGAPEADHCDAGQNGASESNAGQNAEDAGTKDAGQNSKDADSAGGQRASDHAEFERDGTKKKILATVRNMLLALGMLRFSIRYDTFLNRIVLEEKSARRTHQPLKESDYNRLQEQLEGLGFYTPPDGNLRSCVSRVAEEHSFDSLHDYMAALPAWDGVPRIDTFFATYCHTENTPYHTAAGRYLWTALAGRALSPGCKADGVIVLIGEQFQGKTSLITAITPNVEGTNTAGKIALDARDSDTCRKMQGKTICEIAELRGFGTREQEATKDFISSTEDEWVPKYRELARRVPRRTIFIATTNEREFLKDPTGNRRWFPIEVGKIDVDAVRRDQLQLMSEAKDLYLRAGVLYEEAMRLCEAVHARHIKHSELREPIQEALAKIKAAYGDGPFKLDTLLGVLAGKTVAEVSSHYAREVTTELRLMGYDNPNRRYEGQQERRWLRKDSPTSE